MNTVETRYATLSQLSAELKIPLATLRIKVCLAKQRGLEPPPRRRVGRCYLYDSRAFSLWLWENADALRRPFEFGPKRAGDDVESAQ